MRVPAAHRRLGRRHLGEIHLRPFVAGHHGEPHSVPMTEREEEHRLQRPGRERPGSQRAGLGATRLRFHHDVGDVPARWSERQDEGGATVDRDLGAVERDRGRAADHEADDERGRRIVRDLDDHDIAGSTDAVHPLDGIAGRYPSPSLHDGHPLDHLLPHRRVARGHTPAIVGAEPPVERPVVADRRNRAAWIHQGPAGSSEGTDDHDVVPPSSGLASRNMRAGTISPGVRPSYRTAPTCSAIGISIP